MKHPTIKSQSRLELGEAMLRVYGSQTETWPEEARAAIDELETLLAKEPSLAALYAREKRLDGWLDARQPAPSPELEQRVMAAFPTQISPPEAQVIAFAKTSPKPADVAFRAKLTAPLGATLTALAACFMAGFIAAPLVFETLTGAGDPLASLEIISTTFLPTEPL
jgi:hypothetical protein